MGKEEMEKLELGRKRLRQAVKREKKIWWLLLQARCSLCGRLLLVGRVLGRGLLLLRGKVVVVRWRVRGFESGLGGKEEEGSSVDVDEGYVLVGGFEDRM